MNEYGQPLLPLLSPEPRLRLDWEQGGDAENGRSTTLPVHTENPPEGAASHVSIATTIQQPIATTNKPNTAQTIDQQSEDSPGKDSSFLDKYPQCQWKFEIILLITSVCALLATIVLLALEDGVPLDSWRFYFSLNTVISVLGTISRSSLASAVCSCLAQEKWNWFRKRKDHLHLFDLIDNASRGPLGSFKLLLWTRFCHMKSLGAAVIVVLLAFDPFIQAIVIQSGQEDHASRGIDAAIGAASRVDTGILSTQAGGSSMSLQWTDRNEDFTCSLKYYDKWSSQPDLGMVSSVYTGFYNQTPSSLQEPQFTCRTGNCTWTPFPSLAICASCRDATPHITTSTQNVSVKDPGGHTEGLRTLFSLPMNSIMNWDFVYLSEAVGKKRNDGLHDLLGASMVMSAQGTVNGSELYSFRDSTTFLLGFSILHASEDYLNGSVAWNSSRPYGTECGLELCTNIYSTAVVEGTLSEDILFSSSERNMESLLPEFDADSKGCGPSWNQLNNNSLYNMYDGEEGLGINRMNVDRSDLMLYISQQDAAKHGIPASAPLSFNISDRTLKTTITWMKEEFASGHFVWYDAKDEVQFNFFEDTFFWNQSAIASSMVDRSKLADTFGRVADSMTVWMRNLGYSHTPVYGTTSTWVLHIRIRWPFISFPTVTMLAGCVFCTVVILETQRLGLKPWRDSCLAIMAYGIDHDLRDQLRRADDIKKAGRNMTIKMRDGEYGPGLVEH